MRTLASRNNNNQYLMQVGNREKVPVVRISTAAGIWKLGKRACTRVSRAIRANVSAVSTKSIDCLSKKFMMCYKKKRSNNTDNQTIFEHSAFATRFRTAQINTYRGFVNFWCGIGPFHKCQQAYEQLPSSCRKIVNLNFSFQISFAWQSEKQNRRKHEYGCQCQCQLKSINMFMAKRGN